MLFGSSKDAQKNDAATSTAANDAIFDVGTEEFEANVMRASMDTPIIVDFWAPWCGPCKQLGPTLEQAVIATKGVVRMAKVNIDEHPELAQAMRVQSIPTVFAFFGGQPITGFTGNRPASDIKKLMDQLVQLARESKPDAVNIPETLEAANQALADNNPTQAQVLYSTVLEEDENNVAAFVGLVRAFIADGDVETAAGMIENAPETIAKNSQFSAAITAVELARQAMQAGPDNGTSDLAKAVAQAPDNHAARFDYAMALFAAGEREEAMNQLLDSIRRDRAWEDEKARKQLLQFFDAIGPADKSVAAARRQLSSILFS